MKTRPAGPADVEGIARVQVESWEGTYRGLVPDAVFERLTVEHRQAQWIRFFERTPPGASALVAESEDGRLVGMVSCGPTRDDDLDPGITGEIYAIYVVPDHWDTGVGRVLMIEACDQMREAGFTEAILWVLDTNQRGRSFYERGGWSLDGASKLDDSFGEPLSEVRYRIGLV